MKKSILFSISLFACNFIYAQTWQWIPKNNFPGAARYSTAFFEINGKGYMGVGYNGSGMTDFWEYNPLTDSWTQKANFIGTARNSSRGFAIGTDGYFYGGLTTSGYTSDLYKYNSLTNSWTLVNSTCPLPGRQDAFSFVINNKAYITCGQSGIGIRRDDLWEYDPVANAWTQKANFMGGIRSGITGFVIGTDVYLGLGATETPLAAYNDFYKYNTITNTWSPVANFPGAVRHSASSFAINGNGYTGMGANANHTTFYTDFYEYDAATNTWTPSASFFNQGICYPFVFQFNNTAFVGNGWDSTAHYTNKVYQLIAESPKGFAEIANADLVEIYPNPFIDEINIRLPANPARELNIKIFDMRGKIIAEQVIKNNAGAYHLNFKNQSLLSGTYFLQINNGDHFYSKRIIKL